MLTRYEVGQVVVTQGSDLVRGVCTSWLTYVLPQSTLHVGETPASVAEVLDIDRIKLSAPWPGPTLGPLDYYIEMHQANQGGDVPLPP